MVHDDRRHRPSSWWSRRRKPQRRESRLSLSSSLKGEDDRRRVRGRTEIVRARSTTYFFLLSLKTIWAIKSTGRELL